ncbi:MAG TPA: Tat pathway signal protein [Falsiroseomonas sp.]|jgi:hypothetical protein|nr:Tat pathway signal protein [Falsiroseomonas sp.]
MRRYLLVALSLMAAFLGGFVPAAAQAQNRFWLVNDTGRVIERAYVSSARVANWGPDILGTGVLPSGRRVWVTPNFGDCVLDVRVTYQGGGDEERRQVNACSISQIVFGGGGGGTGARIGGGAGAAVSPGAANPSFWLANQTGLTIREVYVSLATQSSWGNDRLGANVLQPGQRLQVSLPAGVTCLVDVRVVYADGRATERRQLNTCSISQLNWR